MSSFTPPYCPYVVATPRATMTTEAEMGIVSYFTPPYYPYAISKGEGGKYPKQVSNEDFPVEVWTVLLYGCCIYTAKNKL